MYSQSLLTQISAGKQLGFVVRINNQNRTIFSTIVVALNPAWSWMTPNVDEPVQVTCHRQLGDMSFALVNRSVRQVITAASSIFPLVTSDLSRYLNSDVEEDRLDTLNIECIPQSGSPSPLGSYTLQPKLCHPRTCRRFCFTVDQSPYSWIVLGGYQSGFRLIEGTLD
jgi:hypothetical protein